MSRWDAMVATDGHLWLAATVAVVVAAVATAARWEMLRAWVRWRRSRPRPADFLMRSWDVVDYQAFEAALADWRRRNPRHADHEPWLPAERRRWRL